MKRLFVPILAFFLIGIDWTLKYFAIKQPFANSQGCFDSFFCIALHQNKGIAFSLPVPVWLTLVITGIILGALLVFLQRLWIKQDRLFLPFSIIFIGAIGNFLDRIINGFTTDYLIFFGISAINIADILIVSGVLLTLWYSYSTDIK